MNECKFLPPANEVCESYVFTGVCLSTGWGRAWWGGRVCVAGGHAWQGGVHGRGCAWQGACTAGGRAWQDMHAPIHTLAETTKYAQ